MKCAHCGDEINGKPYREDSQIFCSLECAYQAAGLETDDEEGYFEEDPVEGMYEEEE